MTKDDFNYYSEKDAKYHKKAKLLYLLFIVIFIVLIVLMFIYQIYTYFVTMAIIFFIMAILYKFVFYEYIYFIRKFDDLKRVKLMKKFNVTDEVIEYFANNPFKQLYDSDFSILQKNNVYTLAVKKIEESIHSVGIAVYLLDNTTDEVNPSTRELSNELSGYTANSSVIKVILLVKDKFNTKELESLEYDSAVHHNTVIIGLEKSTTTLIYNYFLNGNEVDTFLGNLFQLDLTRDEFDN